MYNVEHETNLTPTIPGIDLHLFLNLLVYEEPNRKALLAMYMSLAAIHFSIEEFVRLTDIIISTLCCRFLINE